MVFKRRDRLPLGRRIREFFYPRKGWKRGVEYIGHRIKRLPDPPHKVALGVAAGAFVSFTPFFGLHFFLAAGLAVLIGGNVLAALFGTFVGNPLTFPFIASLSLHLGKLITGVGHAKDFLGVRAAFEAAWDSSWQWFLSLFGRGHSTLDGIIAFFNDVFLPYLVGGILPGVATAVGCYYATRPVVATYQARRRKKLQDVRLERHHAEQKKKKKKLAMGAKTKTN